MAAQPIDYSSRDFASIRADILARATTTLPEWTTHDTSDFTTVLVELWAHAADVLHYYVDRAANEAFPQSAVLRSSMLNLAAMLDYTPVALSAATATVTFTRAAGVSGDITIPAGTQLMTVPATANAAPIYFETNAVATLLSANSTVDVAVTEGRTVTLEALSTSDGSAFQSRALYYPNVIGGSIHAYVYEGASGAQVEWLYTQRLIDVAATSSSFTTFTDEFNNTTIIFGDGVTGRIPPINTAIKSTYRYGVGSAGNVGAGTIVQLVGSITGIGSVSNALAASGGADAESINSMRSSIPLSLRAQDRAVTTTDYAALALKNPAITKANATYTGTAPATTIAAGSNGLSLPQATINVASTAGFPPASSAGYTLQVTTGAGVQTVSYTGLTGTTFTGCTGGTGAMSTGGAVSLLAPVVAVYIAPVTAVAPTAQNITDVTTYLAARTVVGKLAVVQAPTYVGINITAAITVSATYVQTWVKSDVTTALTNLFDYASQQFGARIQLGQVFRAIANVTGLDSFTITVVSRTGSGLADVQLAANEIAIVGTLTITASGGIVGP